MDTKTVVVFVIALALGYLAGAKFPALASKVGLSSAQ